jgi:hypothetical protein
MKNSLINTFAFFSLHLRSEKPMMAKKEKTEAKATQA